MNCNNVNGKHHVVDEETCKYFGVLEVILETIKSSVKSSDKISVNTEDKIKRLGSARKGHWEMNYE